MALYYGFYNSVNGDRKYNATQFCDIFDGVINDGVFDNVAGIFGTVPGEGLQVLVRTGRAWFNKTWNYNDAAVPLMIDTPDVVFDRIDTVVLEVDARDSGRMNSLKIIKGTPSTNPIAPALTTEEKVYQHPLSNVRVRANTDDILASDITILVGTSQCPFVTAILQTTNIDVLYANWEQQFTTWFNNLKAQLNDNVVANLQNQIDAKVNVSDKATETEATAGTNDTKWMTPAKVSSFVSTLLGLSAQKTLQYDVFRTATTKSFPSSLSGDRAFFILVGGGGGGGGRGGTGCYKNGNTVYTGAGGNGGGGGSGFCRVYMVPISLLNGKTITITPGSGGTGGVGGTQNNTYTSNGTNGATGTNGTATTVVIPGFGTLTAPGGGAGGGGGAGLSSTANTTKGNTGLSGNSVEGYAGGTGGTGGAGNPNYTPASGGGGGGGAGGAGGAGGHVNAGVIQVSASYCSHGGNGGAGEISGGAGGFSQYRTTSNYTGCFTECHGKGGRSKNNAANDFNGGSYDVSVKQGLLGGAIVREDEIATYSSSYPFQIPVGGSGILCLGMGTGENGGGGGGILSPNIQIKKSDNSLTLLNASGGGSMFGFGAGGSGGVINSGETTRTLAGANGDAGGVIILYGL